MAGPYNFFCICGEPWPKGSVVCGRCSRVYTGPSPEKREKAIDQIRARAFREAAEMVAACDIYEYALKELETNLLHMADVAEGPEEQIIGVACQLPDGRIYSLPQPHRHHEVLQVIRRRTTWSAKYSKPIQGFITDRGRFLSRADAEKLARANGQLTKPLISGSVMTSEDLW